MWLSSPVNMRPEFGPNYRGEMNAARRNERFIRASRARAGALGGRNLPAPARSDMLRRMFDAERRLASKSVPSNASFCL